MRRSLISLASVASAGLLCASFIFLGTELILSPDSFGETRSDAEGPAAILILVGAAVVAAWIQHALFPETDSDSGSRAVKNLLFRAAGLLLPGPAATRYAEEWAGELYDLRAEGASRWRRFRYVTEVLHRTAPALAVTLRLNARQAVD